MTPTEALRYARHDRIKAEADLFTAQEDFDAAVAHLAHTETRYARTEKPCPTCGAEPRVWCFPTGGQIGLCAERVSTPEAAREAQT